MSAPHHHQPIDAAPIAPPSDRFAYALRQFNAGYLAEAERTLRLILAADSDHADSLHLLGGVAAHTGRPEIAVTLIGRAVRLRDDNPFYLNSLGINLAATGHKSEAVRCFERAITRKPDFAEAHNNLGATQLALLRPDQALASFRRAVAVKADYADALQNLGSVLSSLSLVTEAVPYFERALALRPNHPKSISGLLFTLNYDDRIGGTELAHRHFELGARMDRASPPLRPPHPHPNPPLPERRLRIGYVSPDLRDHPIASFFEPLLGAHDRSRFEIICYAGVAAPDAVTNRLRKRADRWVTSFGLSDPVLAERIRADGIDILVDLTGHGAANRLTMFSHRPAPIQVTWLGYCNTTDFGSIDYRLVDPITDPIALANTQATETLIRLPTTFCCYGAPAEAPEPEPPPCQATGVITFGSFNNPAKLSDSTIAAWAALLHRLPDAQMLLKGSAFGRPATAAPILDRFGRQGIRAERILLVPRTEKDDYLSDYRRVDIALDPFPYNGMTTTCDALWMGVPVVTLRGDRHAARVGASLLTSIGLDGLIAGDVDDYVERAVALARAPNSLAELRVRLRPMMAASPLCHARDFAAAIEAAYYYSGTF